MCVSLWASARCGRLTRRRIVVVVGCADNSACLPKNKCYTAQLSLAELSGSPSEKQQSKQVIAEISPCSYVLHKNAEEYSFCLDAAGACDYCHGDFEMNVEWQGTVNENKKGQSFWMIYNADESA